VALVLVEPSIAPSIINDIKTTEVPMLLRAQGHPLVPSLPVSPPNPSITPSTIKTTEVPLNLRTQGSSGAALNAWVLVKFFGVCGELGAWGFDRQNI
jgi:hypothetical protein